MRSSRLKWPSESGTTGASVSCVDKTNIRTYFPGRQIVDGVPPEQAINFVRDSELGPFCFVEESDDRVHVNHWAVTYIF
jgi:hypothetical protein